MFDPMEDGGGRAGFDPDTAVTVFRAADRAKLVADGEQFAIAAYWPDRYDTTGLPVVGEVEADFRGERAVRLGGPGCPPIAEFAVAAFATRVGWSIFKMRSYLADAVDARHRLPRLFQRACDGRLPCRTVREVSHRTRDLPPELADRVDHLLAGVIAGLSGVRLERRITAALITVDPDRYARLAERARRSRTFHRTQANEHGPSQIYAQLDRADAVRLEATVKQIAAILRNHPDELPGRVDRAAVTAGEWDAIALGVLGQPIRAARLLIDHEQPGRFTDLADLFTPPEDQARTVDGPTAADYPTNTADAPADPAAEPPVDEPPPDTDQAPDSTDFLPPQATPNPSRSPIRSRCLSLSKGPMIESFDRLRTQLRIRYDRGIP